MKTFSPTTAGLTRKWFLIDAENQTLGRLATKIADLLRGKGKPEFAPHLDLGDGVVVINADKIHLTGNKWAKKTYHSHSGWQGGYKEITAEKLHEKKPTKILEFAVAGMIPKTRFKEDVLGRLRLFSGTEHTMTAQKPEKLSF